MEHLINEILKYGGRRDHLGVKVFGAGRVLAAMTDVGRRNIDFTLNYMHTEGFRGSRSGKYLSQESELFSANWPSANEKAPCYRQ